jgi:hypothetical protein
MFGVPVWDSMMKGSYKTQSDTKHPQDIAGGGKTCLKQKVQYKFVHPVLSLAARPCM